VCVCERIGFDNWSQSVIYLIPIRPSAESQPSSLRGCSIALLLLLLLFFFLLFLFCCSSSAAPCSFLLLLLLLLHLLFLQVCLLNDSFTQRIQRRLCDRAGQKQHLVLQVVEGERLAFDTKVVVVSCGLSAGGVLWCGGACLSQLIAICVRGSENE
jgi:hypothetical protein